MVRKGYTPEQIIGKLREVEILLNQDSQAFSGVFIDNIEYPEFSPIFFFA